MSFLSEDEEQFLFEVRNDLLLGNSQGVINAGVSGGDGPTDLARVLLRVYTWRAFLAQGNIATVLSEAKRDSDAPIEERAVAILATVQEDALVDGAAADVKALLAEGSSSPVVRLLAASAFLLTGDRDEALRTLRGVTDLECLALAVQVYLSMDRPDLAEKEVAAMAAIDEDATASQLAAAWVHIAHGGDRLQDAYYTFSELQEKFGSTAMLLNSMAVINIHMGKFELAESQLLEALGKEPSNADTLANLIAVAQHRNKAPEITQRYLNQLRKVAPNHAWLQFTTGALNTFDRVKESV
uniref:Coatomer subunit epsilon n=1 Tax=Sexangularia sp. CB-2014 TaxID=1486929 RepID=A0A7S1VHK0_9EUKA